MAALLAESEGVGEDQDGQEQADDLDGLFDGDNDEEEEYKEGDEEEERDVETEDIVLDLFGDVDDIENEEKDTKGKAGGGDASESLNRSKDDLQGLYQSSLCFTLFSLCCSLCLCSPLEPHVFLLQRS